MLGTYMTAQTPVTITLQNKIRVTGIIRIFDSYVIIVEGQKKEIVYRHAVSCLAPQTQVEPRRVATVPFRPAVPKTQPRPAAYVAPKPRTPRAPAPQVALSASADESSLHNSMKDGLLKWMQEQKAAK